jgi:Tfp pilus assembly protein PilX
VNRSQKQTGVVLAVTLFMLALLTIIGVSAVTLSTTHFRLVGNLQTANETEMALRSAMEQIACEKSGTDCAPANYNCRSLNICVNNHAIQVEVRPRCNGVAYSSAEGGSISGKNVVDTYWDLEGKIVNDVFGANTTVHWGLMVPKGGPCPQPNPYANNDPNDDPECPALETIPCN